MKTTMCLRSSCSMKNCLQTLPHQPTFLSPLKELTCRPLLAGDRHQGCTNALSVTNVSSITQSLSSTKECTAGYSLTTARSVGGRSGRPRCWLVTGCASAKMLRIFASNVGTVFHPHWTNSDTTVQNEAVTMTVVTAARVFRSPAA